MRLLIDALPERRVVGTPPPAVSGLDRRLPARGAGRLLRRGPGLQAGRAALRARRGRPRRPAGGDRGRAARRSAGGPGARALGARRPWPGWPTPTTAIPPRALTLVGITGTNGKTTTSYLVEALLRARGLTHRGHRHDPVRARTARRARRARRRRRRSSSRGCWPRCAGDGVRRRGDGGVLARAGAGPRRRARLRRGGLHQPDPGPSRLPRHASTSTGARSGGCSSCWPPRPSRAAPPS